MQSGVAQEPVDLDAYRAQLERRLGNAYDVSRTTIHKPQANPKQVLFPEGDNDKVLPACHTLVEEAIAHPILLGDSAKIQARYSVNCRAFASVFETWKLKNLETCRKSI